VIVAAHQPNFAPWLGFFDKMLHADVLVLLDTVQFTKRGYQNRTRIKGSGGGPHWLTVPVVTKGRYYQTTRDVEIDETADWRRVHLRTMASVLAKAPHSDALFDCLEPVYAQPGASRLVDVTTGLIGEIVKRLEIPTRLVAASDLDCEGSGSRLMLNLTLAAGGDVYLSGTTGRTYLEPDMFAEAGVELRYHEFVPFEYPQLHGPFVPGLSCLDYLANVGFRRWGR
jgi:WbqC-like protein family